MSRGEEEIKYMSDEDRKRKLTPEQYEVCRNKATEMPFSGNYYDCKEQGVYRCVCCGNELFSSETKFESGTGWPSFLAPIENDNVKEHVDNSMFMRRIEILCNKCGAHLGHVFDDGPAPMNHRYCINSVSIKLEQKR